MQANTTKIGRNDPCPCGSGQKYKKCCAAKDEAARAAAELTAQAAARAAAAELAEDATAQPVAQGASKAIAKRAQPASSLPKPPKGPPPGRAARRKHAV
jgi:hypothetical protein